MGDLGLVEILAIVGGLAIVLMLLYVFQVAKRTREEIRFRAKRVGLTAVLFVSSFLILRSQGYTIWETLAPSFLVGLTSVILIKAPRRSRYIPARVRKAVVARDLKGQPVDPRTYHIDHVVPYSKYGDHSPENLRVVPKDYNLRCGARMPEFLDVLGHKPRLTAKAPTDSTPQSDQDGTAVGAAAAVSDKSSPRGLQWRLTKFAFLVAVVGMVCFFAGQADSLVNTIAQRLRGFSSTVSVPAGTNPESIPPPPLAMNEPQAQHEATLPSSIPSDLAAAKDENATQENPSPLTVESSGNTGGASPPELTASDLPTTPPEPMVRRFTTTELFAFYTRDKRTADYLIKGQVVRVSGTVLKVGMNEVQLRSAGDPDTVKCQTDRGGAFVRPRPTLGTVAVVKGRVRGRGIIGNITLDGCEEVEP